MGFATVGIMETLKRAGGYLLGFARDYGDLEGLQCVFESHNCVITTRERPRKPSGQGTSWRCY